MGKETAVAKVEESVGGSFLVLQQEDAGILKAVLSENLGGGGFSMQDLDQIKVPAGGSIAWSITDENGNEDAVKEFIGIVVAQRLVRSLYTKPYTGEQTPPDCYSADGVHGTGTPGGVCASCKLNEFGSAAQGGGKACKERRMLYILRPGDMLPCVLAVPGTSIPNLRKYMTRLASKAIPALSAVTAFSLVKAQSQGGIAYSQVTFRFAGRLEKDEAERVRDYAKLFEGVLAQSQQYAPSTTTAGAPPTDTDEDNPFDEADEA